MSFWGIWVGGIFCIPFVMLVLVVVMAYNDFILTFMEEKTAKIVVMGRIGEEGNSEGVYSKTLWADKDSRRLETQQEADEYSSWYRITYPHRPPRQYKVGYIVPLRPAEPPVKRHWLLRWFGIEVIGPPPYHLLHYKARFSKPVETKVKTKDPTTGKEVEVSRFVRKPYDITITSFFLRTDVYAYEIDNAETQAGENMPTNLGFFATMRCVCPEEAFLGVQNIFEYVGAQLGQRARGFLAHSSFDKAKEETGEPISLDEEPTGAFDKAIRGVVELAWRKGMEIESTEIWSIDPSTALAKQVRDAQILDLVTAADVRRRKSLADVEKEAIATQIQAVKDQGWIGAFIAAIRAAERMVNNDNVNRSDKDQKGKKQ